MVPKARSHNAGSYVIAFLTGPSADLRRKADLLHSADAAALEQGKGFRVYRVRKVDLWVRTP